MQTIACNTDNEEKADFLYDLSDDLLQNVSINDYNHWKNLKEAMKPKTCDGCKHLHMDWVSASYCLIGKCCSRKQNDMYEPKDNA